jgi:hypothetical protein
MDHHHQHFYQQRISQCTFTFHIIFHSHLNGEASERASGKRMRIEAGWKIEN